MFGVRRMGSDEQMALYASQWRFETVGGDPVTGEIHQRVMAQSWWPLGVDNVFSYTGNVSWLGEQFPLVSFIIQCTYPPPYLALPFGQLHTKLNITK